ncbi:TIGR03751 family conjugal transfer lipoprotein [Xenorhabdus bovienii]|uniref:Putative lipoprotein n=1 Tax=Xenorhabdus bovienii TaxID=40576 RepID=A0A0B6X4Y1_XENBV|nr:TIGR03751 family conjugal transfer lipoprotein [Xenorhabdus bovienii]CDM88635.1 putative lipoprotein [Xenorhabdus bovienii]
MLRATHYLTLLSVVWLLAGCATSKEEILPAGEQTMLAMWRGNTTGNTATVARNTLRRPLTGAEPRNVQDEAYDYSRSATNEIRRQFPRLPNPDMVMYVFPHLAAGTTPIPGYSTVFPFYQQVQYALPGERTEAL